ncbi:hypothetical protein [Tepidimicrobium xylanilyticum]|uniref:hypothetical protein n=1 Tax=Tepidimicrobium xylanilyticum TaxID=1123352 RepID=UPI002650DE1F|nr:hypothetical protein [Tepidimicrobium xylanilyticum]GMG96585.1 hypothetical protein EN5CB1_14110 [Tepidimicrobium xylanilyticum]
MEIVKTPWEVLYKFILFMFGIPLFFIGILLVVMSGNWAVILNALMWIIFSLGFKIKSIYNRHKLETLRRKGICYDGSVVKIIPAPWVRIGSYVTARVECLYKTEKGDSLISSGYYLLLPFDRKEDLHAKIYFDRNNLEKNIIELFRKDTGLSF